MDPLILENQKFLASKLAEIAKVYKPGAIEFYGRLNTDPWQQCIDAINSEKITSEFYKSVVSRNVAKILELNETFPGDGRAPKIGEGTILGFAPGRGDELQSKADHVCKWCLGRKGLSIRQSKINLQETYLSCDECEKLNKEQI